MIMIEACIGSVGSNFDAPKTIICDLIILERNIYILTVASCAFIVEVLKKPTKTDLSPHSTLSVCCKMQEGETCEKRYLVSVDGCAVSSD